MQKMSCTPAARMLCRAGHVRQTMACRVCLPGPNCVGHGHRGLPGKVPSATICLQGLFRFGVNVCVCDAHWGLPGDFPPCHHAGKTVVCVRIGVNLCVCVTHTHWGLPGDVSPATMLATYEATCAYKNACMRDTDAGANRDRLSLRLRACALPVVYKP